MSIYSANRSGCMSTAAIAANESYAFNDCGRIIYESQINDMTLFESILACDFKEVQGLNEGTILESEVKALNKESLKALGKKIADRLKDFWAKIKAVFNSAIQWVSAYILNDGSAFVNVFNSKVGDRINEWKGSIKNIICFDIYNEDLSTSITVDEILSVYDSDYDFTSDLISKLLIKRADDRTVTLNNFTNKMLEKVYYKDTLTSKNVAEYCTRLKDGKAYINKLNERMRKVEKSINNISTTLKSILIENNDENEADININITTIVNAYETVTSAVIKANIAAVRNDMKSRRVALQAVMHDILKTDKAVAEAAAIDAASEFDDVEPTTALDPETQAQVDELIASADTE